MSIGGRVTHPAAMYCAISSTHYVKIIFLNPSRMALGTCCGKLIDSFLIALFTIEL